MRASQTSVYYVLFRWVLSSRNVRVFRRLSWWCRALVSNTRGRIRPGFTTISNSGWIWTRASPWLDRTEPENRRCLRYTLSFHQKYHHWFPLAYIQRITADGRDDSSTQSLENRALPSTLDRPTWPWPLAPRIHDERVPTNQRTGRNAKNRWTLWNHGKEPDQPDRNVVRWPKGESHFVCSRS